MKGFTLVEVITGMVVSVLVGGLLLSILISNTSLSFRESAKVTQGVGVNDVLSSITVLTKQAAGVVSSYPPNLPNYNSDSSTLVLKLPSVDSSGDSIANTFDFAIYFRDGDKIRLKIYPDVLSKRFIEDRILSFNATDLNFQYFNAGEEVTPTSATKVKVTLTLSQQVGTSIQTDTASTEVEFRND